jgi:hypothetical protein
MEAQPDPQFSHRLECVICPEGPYGLAPKTFVPYDPRYWEDFARGIGMVRTNEILFPRPQFHLHLDPTDTSDIAQAEGRRDRLRCVAHLYDDNNQDRTSVTVDHQGQPLSAGGLEVRANNCVVMRDDSILSYTLPLFRISQPGWYRFRVEARYTPLDGGPTRVIAICASPRFHCCVRPSEGASGQEQTEVSMPI